MRKMKYGEITKRKQIRVPISILEMLDEEKKETGISVSRQLVILAKEYFEKKGVMDEK